MFIGIVHHDDTLYIVGINSKGAVEECAADLCVFQNEDDTANDGVYPVPPFQRNSLDISQLD